MFFMLINCRTEIHYIRKLLSLEAIVYIQHMMSSRLAAFLTILTYVHTGGNLTAGLVVRLVLVNQYLDQYNNMHLVDYPQLIINHHH